MKALLSILYLHSLLVYHIMYKVIKPFGQTAALYGDQYFTYALLTDRKQAVMNDHYVYIQTITLGIHVLVFHLHCILHVVLHLIGGFVAMYMYIHIIEVFARDSIHCILIGINFNKSFCTQEQLLVHSTLCRFIKGTLAKIFDNKILPLEIEKRLLFVIKYITLKQTPLTLKNNFRMNAS